MDDITPLVQLYSGIRASALQAHSRLPHPLFVEDRVVSPVLVRDQVLMTHFSSEDTG
jgi:hypothetical protein